jgi:hypothetical protein
MKEIGSALAVFVVLLAGTGVGVLAKAHLPEEHKRHETLQLIQLVLGMLVTFAALVLGLLTASAKTSFDMIGNDFRAFAADLIQLDISLRQYGPQTEPVRNLLRRYTAAAIASTWPNEPAPRGDYPRTAVTTRGDDALESTELGDLLYSANIAAHQLTAPDAFHQRVLDDCLDRFQHVVDARWRLIEEAHSSISQPFLTTLAFWLFIIFLSFGLIAPHNALAFVMITLGAVSIASAMYVIVDLDTPFTGTIVASSQPMRDALGHMNP